MDDNKNKNRAAINRAKEETRIKQEKILEYKRYTEDKANWKTKNLQKIDRLIDLWSFKVFLDQLNPKEFNENQKRKRKERKLK